MASLKLCKPSNGQSANQTKFSEYKHQEYQMKQSSHSEQKWTDKSNQCNGYYGKAQGDILHASDADQLGHDWANNSTRYHAQAQSVLPSPSIHVQEGNHVMETLKKQESHVNQEWATKSTTCSSPTHSAFSTGGAMYHEAHKVGRMEHELIDKPSQCSSPMRSDQYGQTLSKDYTHNENSFEGGRAGNKYHDQHTWDDKPNKFSSSAGLGHCDLAKQKEDHIMGSKDYGWVSSPTHANKSSLVMKKGNYEMGVMDHVLVDSPTQANSSTFNMHKEDHMMSKMNGELAMKPNKCYNPSPSKQYGESMYLGQEKKFGAFNDQGVKGGRADKLGPNQFDYSSNSMYNAQEQHGWDEKSSNSMGLTQMSHSTHSTYNKDDMISKMNGGLGMQCSSPTQARQHGQSMYKGQEGKLSSFNDHAMQGGWSDVSSANQFGYSNNTMTDGQKQKSSNLMGLSQMSNSSHSTYHKDDMIGKMDGGLGLKPTNCLSPIQGKQYGQSMYKGFEDEAYCFNDRGIHNDWGNKSNRNQFMGHSTQHHDCEDENNIDGIMDEILSKYPAHNVSGGHGNWATKGGACVSPNQFGYANGGSWAGSPYHGNSQFTASTYSSSAKKFEMKGMMQNRPNYNNYGF